MNKVILSMSQLGNCARTLTAQHLKLIPEAEIPEYLRLAAREGKRHEQHIKDDLQEHNWKSMTGTADPYCAPCDRFGYHVDMQGESFVLRGHIDDIVQPIKYPDYQHFAEYKALGRFTTDKLLRAGLEKHRTYSMQFSCYATQMKLPGLYVIKNRDTGSMNVEVKQAQYTEDEIVERCAMIANAINTEDILPCDVDTESIDTWSCTKLCADGQLGESQVEKPVPESITKYIGELRQAKSMETVAKKLKSESQAMILSYMSASGRKRLIEDEMQITLVPEGERTIYNVPNEIKVEYKEKAARPAYIRATDKRSELQVVEHQGTAIVSVVQEL